MSSFKWGIFTLITVFSFFVATLSYRLDGTVVPKAYDISITPYLEEADGPKVFSFDGIVQIRLQALLDDVRVITLHKDQIDIKHMELFDNKSMPLQNDLIGSYEKETNKYTIYLWSPLIADVNYTLVIKYEGRIGAKAEGFFRIKYIYPDKKTMWIGATKAERINARKIFPCFDEPAFKATFKMSISRTSNYSSLFNTRLISTEPVAGNRFLDHFEKTPLMSTYQVVFVVTDFVQRGDEDLLFYTPPFYYYCIDFSYGVAKDTIEAFEHYTKLPYKKLGFSTLQKVALPSLQNNCMESCGLVIYRDFYLVHIANVSDGMMNKEDTISMITHEVAHMWFGHGITFKWWSYMWLSEAFARYFQFFMADSLYPDYRFDMQFIAHELQGILVVDSVKTTQPLSNAEVYVQSPYEIGEQLSSIAYGKGSSILRMIRYCMGADNFDTAIREYLQQHQLQNTEPEHLFAHLKRYWPKEPKVNVDEFLRDWTEQVGYPMLIVNITDSGNTSKVSIQQQRFLLDPTDGSDPYLLYTIPITYTTDFDDPSSYEDLQPESFVKIIGEHSFPTKQVAKWIILNRQQANYYRVFYDKPVLENIKTALMATNFSGIHVINRAQIVDDLFNYAHAGLIPYAEVIGFIEFLRKEIHYLPWYATFTALRRIAKRLPLVYQHKLARYVEDISDRLYSVVGFTTPHDTALDIYNRNMMIDWLCKYRHSGCNRFAQHLMKVAIKTGEKPLPDFRETLFCCAMRGGEFSFYQALGSWYRYEMLSSEAYMLLRAMGCTRLHYKTHFKRIISEPTMSRERKVVTLKTMYSENPENVIDIFKMFWIEKEDFVNGLGAYHGAHLMSDLVDYFTTRKHIKMFGYFLESSGKLFGSYESVLDRALERAEKNMDWAESRLGPFRKYLDELNSAPAIYGLSYTSLLLLVVNYYFI